MKWSHSEDLQRWGVAKINNIMAWIPDVNIADADADDPGKPLTKKEAENVGLKNEVRK